MILHIQQHGYFRFTAAQVDAAIAKELPASVVTLRDKAEMLAEPVTFEDVHTVFELLVILIDMHPEDYS